MTYWGQQDQRGLPLEEFLDTAGFIVLTSPRSVREIELVIRTLAYPREVSCSTFETILSMQRHPYCVHLPLLLSKPGVVPLCIQLLREHTNRNGVRTATSERTKMLIYVSGSRYWIMDTVIYAYMSSPYRSRLEYYPKRKNWKRLSLTCRIYRIIILSLNRWSHTLVRLSKQPLEADRNLGWDSYWAGSSAHQIIS